MKHMWLKCICSTVIVVILGIVVFSLAYFTGASKYKGDVYDSWETNNSNFSVKITAHHEAGIFMPGAYISFASAPFGSDKWQHFREYRSDDAISIPRHNFRFINQQTAYVYMENELLVTTDSGKNWSSWIPKSEKSDENKIYYWSIREIGIDENGEGKAKLERFDENFREKIFTYALTKDYGLNWTIKN